MLRSLFSNEFALTTNVRESEIVNEWEDSSQQIKLSIDKRLHSILRNLLIPFIESLYMICKSLLEVCNKKFN